MKARPSFSFYPTNATDPECTTFILRVDFACESGHVFAAYMPTEASLDGFVDLDKMESMFEGVGKIATGLHAMFVKATEKQASDAFSGLDAPTPPEEAAKKYN